MALRRIICIALAIASTASAQGLVVSVKTLGMAGTGVAYPQDSEAAAYNPAGMVYVGDRADIAGEWDHRRQSALVSGNLFPVNGKYNAAHTKDFYNIDGGINKMLGSNMSIGFVGYNRNFTKTTYTKPFVILGTSKLGAEYVHETFSPTFSFKFDDHNSFGISINYMVQRVWIKGIQNFDNPLFSSAPGHVTNRQYNYSQGVGVTLGWRTELTDKLCFGLVYQPETHMSRFKKYKGFIAQRGKFNIPWYIAGGLAYQLTPRMVVAFDVQHYGWREIKALHNPLIPNLFTHKLGEKQGAGFGWRSQTFFRVGADYAINDCLTVRAGYRYVKTPIRRSCTAINLLTCETMESVITGGATWRFHPCGELSVVYAYGLQHKVRGKNSVPLVFGGGEVDLKQKQNLLGVSLGYLY